MAGTKVYFGSIPCLRTGVSDTKSKLIASAFAQSGVGVLGDIGIGISGTLEAINIVEEVPKIVVAVVNMRRVTIK